MRIIENFLKTACEHLDTKYEIHTVTNMGLVHMDGNNFMATFKIFYDDDTNKDDRHSERVKQCKYITCNDKIMHYYYNASNANCLLGIAKVTINKETLECAILDTHLHLIKDPNDNRSMYSNMMDFRVTKKSKNEIYLLGNNPSGKTILLCYNIDSNEVINVLNTYGRNLTLYTNDKYIYIFDFFEGRRFMKFDNVSYKREIHSQTNMLKCDKLFYKTLSNICISGSSNISKINDKFYCIFHTRISVSTGGSFRLANGPIRFESVVNSPWLDQTCPISKLYTLTLTDAIYEYHTDKILKKSNQEDETLTEISLLQYINETRNELKSSFTDEKLFILYYMGFLGIKSFHPTAVPVYFHYFAELKLENDTIEITKISSPIFIKYNCFNGITFVCGLTANENNMYISYGINDLDSNVLVLTQPEFDNIVNTNDDNILIIDKINEVITIEKHKFDFLGIQSGGYKQKYLKYVKKNHEYFQ